MVQNLLRKSLLGVILTSSIPLLAQNVGIGTATPSEKLHVAGASSTLRIEGLAATGTYNGTASTTTDKLVWVDANGVVRSLNMGTAGQVLTVNNSGVLTWGATNGTITTKDVVATGSNNAILVTNGAGQVVGTSNLTIGVANNALGQAGVVAAPSAANANQVWGTDASGNPAWINALATIVKNDVVSANSVIAITNGLGQVVGGSNLTITAASNALNQSGYVVGPTAANANQVWGTDAFGNPAWINAITTILKNDIVTSNPSITITNGTGQVIGGTNVSIDVAANSATTAGLVAAGAGNNNMIWGTDGSGNPAWMSANTNIVKNDVVSGNAITVTNGTGQVVGGSNLTITANNNALNQTGVVAGPTAANANQVWGTDASGNPAWVSGNTTLVKKDILAGTGNSSVSITNGTGQVIGASNVTVNVASNALGQDGVVTGPTAADANLVWGTNAGGNPGWMNVNTNIIKKDVTTSTTGVTIGNGTGQVVGAANVTVDVATNSAGSPGLVKAGSGSNNKVWATDGAGSPDWRDANTTIVKNDIVSGTAGVISITNGTGQVVGGSNVSVAVSTNGLNQAGVVPGPTFPTNILSVWATNAAGVPSWTSITSTIPVDNGLYVNLLAGKIRQGGALVENTTISEGNFNYLHNLTGTGNFEVRNSATAGNGLFVGPNDRVGVGTAAPAQKLEVGGTGNTVRVGGIATGGTFLAAAAANTDRIVYANTTGDLKAIPAGTSQQVLTTNATGVPVWQDATANVHVQNGLNLNTTAPNASAAAPYVELGGTLVRNTTVTNSTFNMTFNLDNTGDFDVQDNGTSAFFVRDDGNVGISTNAPTERLHIAGNSNTARIDGVSSTGTHLTSPTATTDRMMYTTNTGVVKAMPNGATNSFLTINAAGIPSWQGMTALVDNGLYFNTGAGKIRQGGNLVENTTITELGFNYTHDLTGTGDFIVTEASNATPSLFVKGNDVTATDGFVGIGTNNPANRLHIVHNAVTGMATASSFPVAIGYTASTVDMTMGSDASFGLMQTWNLKPLLINSQGNFVGINKTTAPIQNLDINGRMAVQNGVIQRGTTQINVTNDLGLYSQVATNWIRIASNAAPIKFFTDQGGGNSAGTNSLVDFESANGGGVAISAETSGATSGTPNALAVLDLQSSSKGMLFPRLTTAQRDAIAGTIPEGLHIYNTDTDCLEFFDTKADPPPPPTGGFWNSYCEWCDVVVNIPATTNGLDFNAVYGVGARHYCVFIPSTVTIGATAAGGAALNFTNLPAGSTVTLYNYGRIVGGGGNGGQGGGEGNNSLCSGWTEQNGQGGQPGGHAITTTLGVNISVFNYGLIGGGGGGGGGGDPGCCSAGGGGSGGAGIPAGSGGGGNATKCANCIFCSGLSCSTPSGASGNTPPGFANASGGAQVAISNCTVGCSTQVAGNAGGAGGSLGNNGNTPPDIGCGGCSDCRTPGAGGAGGKAIAVLPTPSAMPANSITTMAGGLTFGGVQ